MELVILPYGHLFIQMLTSTILFFINKIRNFGCSAEILKASYFIQSALELSTTDHLEKRENMSISSLSFLFFRYLLVATGMEISV